MFPYERRLKWHLSHPSMHLVTATRNHLDQLGEPYRAEAISRCDRIPRALKVRLVLLALLSPTILATAISAIARALPFPDDLVAVFDAVLSIAGALAVVLTVLFLIVNRYVDQLEKDLVACLAIGTTSTVSQD